MSQFIDEVTLFAKAGDGGHGCVAWRREAHVPRGGPAGGDGGDGGDVVLVADAGVGSLLDFKYEPQLKAQNGEPGRGKNQAGKMGDDVTAKVPIGTQVFDEATGALVADLTTHGQREVICRGGSGGFGNARFATPSRQAPDFRKPGLPGEERAVRLSLKLMADVGLLGFPNAGKSTFLARTSAARPKIADYPFTTLVPQLGVVRVPDGSSFVLADIPGLIEGAADGAGLGIRFLKHLERVRVLLHLVEVPLGEEDDAEVLVRRYEVLRKELSRFSAELARTPEIVAVNKLDARGAGSSAVASLKAHLQERGVALHEISGVTGQGVRELLFALSAAVKRAPAATPVASTSAPTAASPFARARVSAATERPASIRSS